MTSREAALAAENPRLRQQLTDACLRVEEAVASAVAASETHAASLAESTQETHDARQGTRQAYETATHVSAEHQAEIAVHQAAAVRQKKLYAALHTSEGRLRLILERAKDFAIFMIDLDGRVTEWSSGACSVLGWSEAEILGQNARVIWTPEDQKAGMPGQEMRLARDEGRAADERWHVRRDGSQFWAAGDLVPMQDETGRLVGYLKMLRDRTEQHLASVALRAGEEKFRTILDKIQAGFAIVQVKFDTDDRPVNYRFVEANPAFEQQAGVNLRGKWVTEFAPDLEQFWFDTYGHVAKTGEPTNFES